MSSPEVWAAARDIIGDGAAALGLSVAWPNEPFAGVQPTNEDGSGNYWLAVEASGDVSAPMELGASTWHETGAIEVHVMGPVGLGITDALGIRKAVANWFRFASPGAGITYRDATLDPGGRSEDGNWNRLSVRVAYDFTDH